MVADVKRAGIMDYQLRAVISDTLADDQISPVMRYTRSHEHWPFFAMPNSLYRPFVALHAR